METVDGTEFVSKIYRKFTKSKVIEKNSKYTPKRAVFPERFNKAIRDLPIEPVSRKENQIGSKIYQSD